jgi:PD-(D/E)XK nuclease superfamily
MRLPPASHTMLQNFDNCPFKGFRMYIAKDLPKGAPSKEMEWGQTVHKAMEKRLSRGTPLPAEMQKYEHLVSPLVVHKPLAEVPLAIRADGSPCGFFDDDVFCRGYGDVAIVKGPLAVLFDWKTGKKREDKAELRLHALMLQAKYSSLTQITGYYVWLQEGKLGALHNLSETHETWADLNEQMDEIKFMAEQGSFPKTPNPLCGWCAVLDCEHNKVKQRLAKEAAQ